MAQIQESLVTLAYCFVLFSWWETTMMQVPENRWKAKENQCVVIVPSAVHARAMLVSWTLNSRTVQGTYVAVKVVFVEEKEEEWDVLSREYDDDGNNKDLHTRIGLGATWTSFQRSSSDKLRRHVSSLARRNYICFSCLRLNDCESLKWHWSVSTSYKP